MPTPPDGFPFFFVRVILQSDIYSDPAQSAGFLSLARLVYTLNGVRGQTGIKRSDRRQTACNGSERSFC
jgi:hypothetical protein